MKKNRQTNLLIGVTGGIAIYKILDLISILKKNGNYNTTVAMSDNAQKFITPLTFSTVTGNKTYTTLWDKDDFIPHISLADNNDVFLLAPATYNIIGKIANGIADDLISTIASAFHSRKLIAPAMNVNMYQNPILKENIEKLKKHNWEIISPDEGMLACNYKGKGKLAKPETIFHFLHYDIDHPKLLEGKRVLITAGGTIEQIDPVRYITNKSSGKMGISLAEVCTRMGAEVTLITGNINTELPNNTNNIKVNSAIEMKDEVIRNYYESDIIIMSSAVADYRVENVSEQKIKKSDDTLTLNLIKNPDILMELSKLDKDDKIIVGFAAESENLEQNAIEKLKKKNLDLIVANDISLPDSGFNSDYNKVIIYDRNGEKEELPKMTKIEVSKIILKKIAQLIKKYDIIYKKGK
jgi:phosphopantothenoylcysteine decarboxylase / phosphopantothenate---cysteine ligase